MRRPGRPSVPQKQLCAVPAAVARDEVRGREILHRGRDVVFQRPSGDCFQPPVAVRDLVTAAAVPARSSPGSVREMDGVSIGRTRSRGRETRLQRPMRRIDEDLLANRIRGDARDWCPICHRTAKLGLRSGHREIHPPEQIAETFVPPQTVEQRVNCQQRQVPESFLVRLFQPLQREIRLTQSYMDRRP